MPVTSAHPALIYPLRKLKSFHYSALIIGSCIPDFIHFVPSPFHRGHTHDLLNTLILNLPIALFVYLLFHLLLKRPLWDILPDWFQKRIPASHLEGRFPKRNRWIPILISLYVGIFSHILWDSFTHYYDFGAKYLIPILSKELFTISKYTIYPTTFLQHGSSILGTLFIAYVLYKWFMKQKAENKASRKEFAIFLFTIAFATTGAYALPQAFVDYPVQGSLYVKGCQTIRIAVFGGGKTIVLGIVLYAVLWNSFKRFRQDSRGWQEVPKESLQ